MNNITENECKRQLVLGMTRYDTAEELDGCSLNLQLLLTVNQLHHTTITCPISNSQSASVCSDKAINLVITDIS